MFNQNLTYLVQDILTHRRPPVTAFAIHPTGHFFAVGHADGSIAFWAVEDEDRPILVRTTDSVDVDVVDGNKLEKLLNGDQVKPYDSIDGHEPIFKLAWSG